MLYVTILLYLFMTVRELYVKFKSFDTQKEGIRAVEVTKDEAVVLNRKQLYFSSVRSDGSYLQAYRSEFYAEYKNQKNPSPGFGAPDLYDTGSFQNKMFAVVNGGKLEFSSKDSKIDKLVEKYGKNIFGLTKQSLEEYAKVTVHNELVRRVKEVTGLK